MSVNWREKTKEKLVSLGVAGQTKHSRKVNLRAIRKLAEGEPFYTLGVKEVSRFKPERILEYVASITKCSKDINKKEGSGYISPDATVDGLSQAAHVLKKVIDSRKLIFLGTGHPGSLIVFYQELAKLIKKGGGALATPARERIVNSYRIDYVGGVAVVTDGCSLFHIHDSFPMEIIVRESSMPIGLAFVDHGFVGGAVKYNIPVVAIMDTNDPAIAILKSIGHDITIIPMDDNCPSNNYVEVVRIMEEMIFK